MATIKLVTQVGSLPVVQLKAPTGPMPVIRIPTLAYVPVPGPPGPPGSPGTGGGVNIVVADGEPGDTNALWYDTSD